MLQSTIQTGMRDGMRTMDHCLLDLYQHGVITWDTAVSHARNIQLFKKDKTETH